MVCTDINPYAVDLTRRNFMHNHQLLKGTIDSRYGDIFSTIKKDERFDVVIFNPPYLPTLIHERIGGSGWFDLATDGGVDGLAVTKRFIEGVHKVLSKNGRAYFVFSTLANQDRLTTYLTEAKLKSEIVSSRRFDDELIDVYQIYF